MTDYPDGVKPAIFCQTAQLFSGFSEPWSAQYSQSLASGDTFVYRWTAPDSQYLYLVESITIWQADNYWGFGYGKYIDMVFFQCSFQGSYTFPAKDNPVLFYLKDDYLDVGVVSLAADTRTYRVSINGVKILKPAGYGHAPMADFSALPLLVEVGSNVTFTDASRWVPTSWLWDFGDGGSSALQNPVRAYLVAGVYSVKLRSTNSIGFDVLQKTSYITVYCYEVLTAYVEVDTGGYLAVATNKVDWTLFPGNKTAYLYKDFGAYYFNGIKIRWNMKVTKRAASLYFGAIELANDVASVKSGSGKRILVYYSNSSIYLEYVEDGVDVVYDSTAYDLNTAYYLELERIAGSTTTTLKIYSDDAYTVLLDTLTLALAGFDLKFRYLYAFDQFVSAITNTSTGYNNQIQIISH